MAWTTDEIAALKDAIASGARRVTYRDKTVEYRSLDEMLKVLAMMELEVSGGRPSISFAKFTRA